MSNTPIPKTISRRIGEHLLALALVTVFTAALFHPLWVKRTYSMMGMHWGSQYPWAGIRPSLFDTPEARPQGFAICQTDHADTYFPTTVAHMQSVLAGKLPLWNPYNLTGLPSHEFSTSFGSFYPLRYLLAFTRKPWLIEAALTASHFWLAGFGAYLLARTLGANWAGALLAGMIWEANGQSAFWLTMQFDAIAAGWLPVAIHAAVVACRIESWRWATFSGVAVGMMILSGPYLWIIPGGVILAAVYAASSIRSGWIGQRLAPLALPFWSLAVGLALSAVQWAPLAASASSLGRSPPSLETQLNEKISVTDKLQNMWWTPQDMQLLNKPPFQFFGYVGPVALAMALVGVFVRPHGINLIAAVSIAGLIACIAGWMPALGLLRRLPTGGALHFYNLDFAMILLLAWLAASGLTAVEAGLRCLPGGRIWAGVVVFPLLSFHAANLVWFTTAVNPQQGRDESCMLPETPLIRFLKDSLGESRLVATDAPVGAWLPSYFEGRRPAVFKLRTVSGYESLLPSYLAKLTRCLDLDGLPDPNPISGPINTNMLANHIPVELLRKLSVKFILTQPNAKLTTPDGIDLVANGTLVKAYENCDGLAYRLSDPGPRVTVVDRVRVADGDDALRAFVDPAFSNRDESIVSTGDLPAGWDAESGLGGGGRGTAKITHDGEDRVKIDASAAGPSILVLHDGYAPGWVATVDGKPAKIVRANYAFRGVFLEPGQHRVVFSYRPLPVYVGLVVSAVSAVALLGYGAWLVSLASIRRVAR